ncbi:MAG: alpha/beta hydrolase, partial [Alcaligenaceae bacterium]|nr:alpha/beta hydrolase [Alcaligenaceae bacterium]
HIDGHQALDGLASTARRKSTPCGSGKIIWHIWGGPGPAVVLLHGGSGSWVHWCRNISALVHDGYAVYVPDLPGFGASDLPPAGFDADAHTEWIVSGLDELLGQASCSVTGFSFGAMVATFIAARNPSQVDRLILVGAPALTQGPGARLAIRNWRAPEYQGKVREAHRHNLHTIMLATEESATEFAVDIYGADAERDRIPQRRLFKTDVLMQLMPSVQCPVWGIWGGDDALHRNDMAPIQASLSKAPQFGELRIIPDAGHWVQFEAAGRFNQVLRTMLGSSGNQRS